MKFAIVFIDSDDERLPVPDPETEPEPDEEDDLEKETDEEEVVEEPSEPAGGWDGWKKLLLLGLDLGDDFKLPEPITTPGYVPTPPEADLNKISVKGSTQISFSEPVF